MWVGPGRSLFGALLGGRPTPRSSTLTPQDIDGINLFGLLSIISIFYCLPCALVLEGGRAREADGGLQLKLQAWGCHPVEQSALEPRGIPESFTGADAASERAPTARAPPAAQASRGACSSGAPCGRARCWPLAAPGPGPSCWRWAASSTTCTTRWVGVRLGPVHMGALPPHPPHLGRSIRVLSAPCRGPWGPSQCHPPRPAPPYPAPPRPAPPRPAIPCPALPGPAIPRPAPPRRTPPRPRSPATWCWTPASRP